MACITTCPAFGRFDLHEHQLVPNMWGRLGLLGVVCPVTADGRAGHRPCPGPALGRGPGSVAGVAPGLGQGTAAGEVAVQGLEGPVGGAEQRGGVGVGVGGLAQE